MRHSCREVTGKDAGAMWQNASRTGANRRARRGPLFLPHQAVSHVKLDPPEAIANQLTARPIGQRKPFSPPSAPLSPARPAQSSLRA